MKEHIKSPERQSRTVESNSNGFIQPPVSEILQAYRNGTLGRRSPIQRESIEEDDDLTSGQPPVSAILQQYGEKRQKYASEEDEEILQGKFDTAQRQEKTNNTGLPDNLKSGVENLSGYSIDDVKVHYNSDKPAQLNALAYAQGTDIHVAPGQEKHLPHEAWHVVQQKQGRVQPTVQMQGVNVNDNERLEKEADVMGKEAINNTELTTQRKTHFKITKLKSSIAQLERKNVQIDWLTTHLVKMIDGSIFYDKGESFLSNEDKELDYGDIVEIDGSTEVWSRRGANQENPQKRLDDQNSEHNNLWYKAIKVNGVEQEDNIYIRAETFHEIPIRSSMIGGVTTSEFLYSMVPAFAMGSVKSTGLLSSYKRTGEKKPQEGGAYLSTYQIKLLSTVRSHLCDSIRKILDVSTSKPFRKKIAISYIDLIPNFAYELSVLDLPYELKGEQSDYEKLEEERNENIRKYKTALYDSTSDGANFTIKEMSTTDFGKMIKQESEKVYNNIKDNKNHFLTQLACRFSEKYLRVEGMITSQHIYFFEEKYAKEAYSDYSKRMNKPAILRIAKDEIVGIEEDKADYMAKRTKESAPPHLLEIFAGIDFNDKEQRVFPENWIALNKVKI